MCIHDVPVCDAKYFVRMQEMDLNLRQVFFSCIIFNRSIQEARSATVMIRKLSALLAVVWRLRGSKETNYPQYEIQGYYSIWDIFLSQIFGSQPSFQSRLRRMSRMAHGIYGKACATKWYIGDVETTFGGQNTTCIPFLYFLLLGLVLLLLFLPLSSTKMAIIT